MGEQENKSVAFKIGQLVARRDWAGLAFMPLRAMALGIGVVPFLAGAFLIVAGLVVIFRQATGWLRTGNWSPLEFRLAWQTIGGTEPDLPGLRGVQKILVWCLDQPLSVSLAVCGATIIIVGVIALMKIDEVLARSRVSRTQ
jgi:hypothetical protein